MFYLINKIIQFLNKNKKEDKKDKERIQEKLEALKVIDKDNDFDYNKLEITQYADKIIKDLKNFENKETVCKKEYLIIIDDNYGIISSIQDYVDLYSDTLNLKNIEIKTFSGSNAAKEFIEFAKDNFKCIKYAIFDITLNERIQIINKVFTIDGIDLAIFLKKLKQADHDQFYFTFYTGNILNRKINYIKNKIKKFEFFFNIPFDSKIIQKDFLKNIKQLEIIFKKINLLKESENIETKRKNNA